MRKNIDDLRKICKTYKVDYLCIKHSYMDNLIYIYIKLKDYVMCLFNIRKFKKYVKNNKINNVRVKLFF